MVRTGKNFPQAKQHLAAMTLSQPPAEHSTPFRSQKVASTFSTVLLTSTSVTSNSSAIYDPSLAITSAADIFWVSHQLLSYATAVPTVGIASRSTDVTSPVTRWREYLSGWDLSNSVLQLVVEMFLVSLRSFPLRCILLKEGENCLANDQLVKEDPARDTLDFNNLVCPTLCQQYTSSSKTCCLCTEELNLQYLPIMKRTCLDSRISYAMFQRTTDVESLYLQCIHFWFSMI